ncbi:MAG: hypothetical protein A2X13_14560 [Bacteroidetes bacterium GWC2_33_15]|nr:MAG: hypothetical protein A2X10_12605 [Bacteroidetes bacterium GWA2_33_15]OFX50094.1 MAG: hypothetical protein A2X13_14560 [Bacteroidetes bacterium GWC2_33_15]OFX65247.1 MAG: hypothetical protein A2X15_04135 [Bacteroidetes bacterium GWB2_32_14]OFX70473.1 MAG: hypothetical protein A2X14_04190 [Bacteroidetes bacterium GWD2_33_33]HAN19654.1 hypothetical protein [Bacteroidales bacterium]
MKRKTIYLSIPITGIENSIESREKAALTQANYERQGFIVNNPHVIADELTEILNRIPIEAEKMAADIDYLAQSDLMVLFPGWQQSVNCRLEIAFASIYNIPIWEAGTDHRINFKIKLEPNIIHTCKDSWIFNPMHSDGNDPEINIMEKELKTA